MLPRPLSLRVFEGTAVNVDHFVPGQYVDVIGKTVGKGHAGVMKRHNMAVSGVISRCRTLPAPC